MSPPCASASISMKATAYGDKVFTGKIARIGRILGRKNVRTDEPTERVDTKILETLVDLDPGSELPSASASTPSSTCRKVPT